MKTNYFFDILCINIWRVGVIIFQLPTESRSILGHYLIAREHF